MDVRCRQCGTEYELDDARVAAAGTTVKCSNCGHVFKVLPGGSTKDASGALRPAPGPEPTPPLGTPPSQPPQSSSPPPVSDWMVKKVDGQVFRFKELTTLQKWIVERKVVRDDEISRTGKSWKKLGARKPVLYEPRSSSCSTGVQRSASLGLVVVPKSL